MKVIKSLALSIAAVALMFGLSIQSEAALQNLGTDSLGNQLIYDIDRNITWYDYSNATASWQNQVDWASALSVTFGDNVYTDWRLPTALNQDGSGPCSLYNCTGGEMGHLYYTELGNVSSPISEWGLPHTDEFQNLVASSYWLGTEYAPNTEDGWYFSNLDGYQYGYSNNGSVKRYAIAVRDGVSTAVAPEPISSTLFIIGGATMGFRRFRKK